MLNKIEAYFTLSNSTFNTVRLMAHIYVDICNKNNFSSTFLLLLLFAFMVMRMDVNIAGAA